MGKTNRLHLEFFYRPPNNSVEPLVDLSASLDEFNDSAEIVLVGDFNLPDIDWSTNSVFRDTDLNCRLMDILLDHFMSQQVLELTRGKKHLRSRDNNKRGVDKKSTSWRTFLRSQFHCF